MLTPEMNDYSLERVKQELVRSSNDPIYWINNYGTIFDEISGGIVPFKLFRNYKLADGTVCGQRQIAKRLIEDDLVVVEKGRQIGITWECAHFSLHDMIFHKDRSIFVVSKDETTAGGFIDKVLTIFDNLPEWMKPTVFARRDKKLLHFAERVHRSKHDWKKTGHNSIVRAYASVNEVLRSVTPTTLILDEFAFIPFLGKKMIAMLGSRSTSLAKMWIISTANGTSGVGETFFKICTHARNGVGQYRQFGFEFAGYHTDPRRGKRWVKEQKELMGPEFRQEHPATPEEAFIASGDCYFDTDLLATRIQALLDKPPKLKVGDLAYNYSHKTKAYEFKWLPSETGMITIFKGPTADHTYSIGSDPAEGGPRSDNLVAYVIDDQTKEYVAELCCKLEPDQFADVLATLGFYYNTAFIGVEANKGDSVSRFLVDAEKGNYPSVYLRETIDTLDPKSSDKLGWFSTPSSKMWLFDNYKINWRQDKVKIPFINLLLEMQNVLLDKSKSTRALGRIGAQGRNPDDRPDAAAIALEMSSNRPAIPEEDQEAKKQERLRIKASKEIEVLFDRGIMATTYKRRQSDLNETPQEMYEL